nr:MAG TPA: Protein of unknown function (DUF2591) [Caudoviricetes sp.]DAK77123.1 MAG TPA: Protein of unknown function (DUF2591) [Caudoviricetes sp.]
MTEFVEVNTQDLAGAALDWAVAKAEIAPLEMPEKDDLWGKYCAPYSPSTNWIYGGPLVEKFGVLLSPPESMVHVHGGPNAGWQQSGHWGATIFRKGEHKRKAHRHPTEPLVAAMRCVVGWSLGEVVSVPKELLS